MNYVRRRRCSGVALFFSMILLLVLTLIAVTIMSNTAMQERMAGNQKRVADASMAAEAGVAWFYDWLSGGMPDRWATGANDLPESPPFGVADSASFEIVSWESAVLSVTVNEVDDTVTFNREVCGPTDTRCILSVSGRSGAGDASLADVALQAEFLFGTSGRSPGDYDLLCGDHMDLRRIRFFNTSAHCEGIDGRLGRVTTSGEGGGQNLAVNSNITASDEVSVAIRANNCQPVGQECSYNPDSGPAPPLIGDRVRGPYPDPSQPESTSGGSFFEKVRASEDAVQPVVSFYTVDPVGNPVSSLNDVPLNSAVLDQNSVSWMGSLGESAVECGSPSVHTCDFSGLTEADANTVYFCNGNVNFGGGGGSPVSNITVIATCDITHNGALNQAGGPEINNAFYAGGDMIFNGRTGGNANDPNNADSFSGVFYAGGDVTFNGNVTITGKVQAEGSITANGWLNFFGSNPIGGNVDGVETFPLSLVKWRQRWFDGE